MTPKTILQEKLTEKAVNTFKNSLVKELGHGLVSVVFFGSRQKGKFAPDSDIDMLVVVREKILWLQSLSLQIATLWPLHV